MQFRGSAGWLTFSLSVLILSGCSGLSTSPPADPPPSIRIQPASQTVIVDSDSNVLSGCHGHGTTQLSVAEERGRGLWSNFASLHHTAGHDF